MGSSNKLSCNVAQSLVLPTEPTAYHDAPQPACTTASLCRSRTDRVQRGARELDFDARVAEQRRVLRHKRPAHLRQDPAQVRRRERVQRCDRRQA
jgi:hypothetical protein